MEAVRVPVSVPLDDILIEEAGFNSRRENITPLSVKDIQEDIAKNGLDQPIHLWPLSTDHPSGKKYRVLAGFRRTRSCQWLGWKTIPAFIRNDIVVEDDARAFNIRENIQRKNLTLVDEAYAIMPYYRAGAPPKWIAEKIGMTKRWVEERLMVGKLPDAIQNEIAKNPTWFKRGHIERMADMDEEHAATYVHQIKTHAAKGETLPVRGTQKSKGSDKKKRTYAEMTSLGEAIWDSLGAGIETRLLAWARGDISNFEIITDLNTVAMDRDRVFIPPEDLSAL